MYAYTDVNSVGWEAFWVLLPGVPFSGVRVEPTGLDLMGTYVSGKAPGDPSGRWISGGLVCMVTVGSGVYGGVLFWFSRPPQDWKGD